MNIEICILRLLPCRIRAHEDGDAQSHGHERKQTAQLVVRQRMRLSAGSQVPQQERSRGEQRLLNGEGAEEVVSECDGQFVHGPSEHRVAEVDEACHSDGGRVGLIHRRDYDVCIVAVSHDDRPFERGSRNRNYFLLMVVVDCADCGLQRGVVDVL